MNLWSKSETLWRVYQERGWVETGRFVYDWLAKGLFAADRIEFVWLDPQFAKAPEVNGQFEFRFLNADDLKHFLTDQTNELNQEVIDRLVTGKHFCYAALEGGKLAAYSWYAFEHVDSQDCFGFCMKLPANVAYMYKGFTHPDFRGKRLHGYLMVKGLNLLNSQGVESLISTIDWLNSASIKSSERIGYQRIGQGVSWKFLGKTRQTYPPQVLAKGVTFIL